MLRREYNQSVWQSHIEQAFPHLSGHETIIDVSRAGSQIQDLRNRIFHHEPLVGRNLTQDYSAILRMIGWICLDMREWTRAHSSVPSVLRERPR